MGTRADFYIGRGKDAEYLGSIAFDGYPDGHPKALLACKTASAFRRAVTKILAENDDSSSPTSGWPWPWETSAITDYAYAFDGSTWVSCFGCKWVRGQTPKRVDAAIERVSDDKSAEFPRMSVPKGLDARRNGIFVLTVK